VLLGTDFSAVESRVLAWLADDKKKLATYRAFDETGNPELEPYCVTASKILGRTVTPADEEGRAIGKTADLALGFGGSVGAWRKLAPNDTRSDEEIKANVSSWRAAHPPDRAVLEQPRNRIEARGAPAGPAFHMWPTFGRVPGRHAVDDIAVRPRDCLSRSAPR